MLFCFKIAKQLLFSTIFINLRMKKKCCKEIQLKWHIYPFFTRVGEHTKWDLTKTTLFAAICNLASIKHKMKSRSNVAGYLRQVVIRILVVAIL